MEGKKMALTFGEVRKNLYCLVDKVEEDGIWKREVASFTVVFDTNYKYKNQIVEIKDFGRLILDIELEGTELIFGLDCKFKGNITVYMDEETDSKLLVRNHTIPDPELFTIPILDYDYVIINGTATKIEEIPMLIDVYLNSNESLPLLDSKLKMKNERGDYLNLKYLIL